MRRDLGHTLPAECVEFWLVHPPALPVQASGNAVIESCYFASDIVQISLY